MQKYEQGVQALNQDNFTLAIQCFELNIQANLNWTLSMLAKATACYRSNRRQSAIECYCQVLQRHKSNIEAIVGKGRVFTSLGEYEEAKKCFTQALNIDDENWKVYQARGYTLNRTHKYQQAILSYENAITKNHKNDPISYAGRAEAFFYTKRFQPGQKDMLYAAQAINQKKNIENLSKTEIQILKEGIFKYQELTKQLRERENVKKISTPQKLYYQLEIIKILNKSYHLHNLNLLRNGIKNIKNAIENNHVVEPDAVVYEGEEPTVMCGVGKRNCRTH